MKSFMMRLQNAFLQAHHIYKMDEFYRQIGERVQKLRLAAKMSQEELARKLELSQLTVVHLESGKQKLTVDRLLLLAGIFGVSAYDIVPELGKPKEPSSSLLNPEQQTEKEVLSALEEVKKNL